MAALLNDRNELLFAASSRITGASVVLSGGTANSLVIPKNATVPVPGAVTLTASVIGYTAPSFAWSYRFGNSGNFTNLTGSTNTLVVTLDAAFLTALGTASAVQYKVTVTETTGNLGINQSENILNIPVLREGVDGVAINSAQVILYRRTATATAPAVDIVPSSKSTYTFLSGQVVGQPANWAQQIPDATLGAYLWSIQVQAAGVQASYEFLNTLWSQPVLYTRDGTQGVDGNSVAQISAYQRATVVPTTKPGTINYSFATNNVIPWDITTAVYSRNYVVNTQETIPESVFFKPDGLSMYTVGSASDRVNQYTLTKAWDVSSASFTAFFSVAAQETAASGLFFKPDGLKMYIVGITNDSIREYTLSQAWDVSTAVFAGTFSVTAQETFPRCVFFKPDGLTVYITGSTSDRVNQYNLSTAWSISTAAFNQFLSVSAQDTSPEGLFFSPDGTKMFISGNTNDKVYEYNLSTAWNISTATYSQQFSVAGQDTAPKGIFFRQDGLKLYVAGDTNNSIYEYSLGIHNDWQLTIPDGIDPIYVTTAVASSTSSIDTINTSEWSDVVLLAQNGQAGQPGASGLSTALVYAYKRSATAVTDNPGAVDYSFTSNTITTATLANTWLKAIPTGTDPLYVTVATASSTTGTDSIAAGDWTSPVVLTQNGINTATVTLYARNSNSATAPTLTRTGEATYTFGSGVLSGTIPAGWTQAIPAESNGSVIWAVQATAAGTGISDNILNTEWSDTPRVLSQAGAPGAQGTRGSRQLYTSSSTYTSTYTLAPNAAGFASYAATATSLIATATTGSIPTTPIKGDTVTFTNPTAGSEYVYTLTYGDTVWATPGTVIDGSLLVTGSVTAAKVDTRGLSIKDANGNIILQAGNALDWSAVPIGLVPSQNLVRNGSFQLVNASNFTSNYSLPLAITTGSTSGTTVNKTASLSYLTQSPAPFVVGEQIIVSGVTPVNFNGTFVVTACTTTQVQYAITTATTTNITVTAVGSIVGTRFLTNDGRAANGSIYRAGPADIQCEDFIPVDSSQTYEFKVSAKSVGSGGNSVAYLYAACYDRDRQLVRDYQNQHYANTRTTLAADLVAGATTVTVTSSVNWQPSAAGLRYIGFSIDGYTAYTYAKLSLPYQSYNATTNVITLAAAYTGTTIKAGTPVANYYEGGGVYNHCIANNVTVPNTWTDYTGTLSPIPSTDLYTTNRSIFRHGTAYIRVGGLLNEAQTSTRVLRLDDWVAQPATKRGDIGYTGITSSNVGTYITDAAIGNAQIASLIYSNNFNGTLDTSLGTITSNGTTGWAISKSGNAVFQSGIFRGDITGSSGTFSGSITGATGTFAGTVSAGNVTGALMRATTIPPTYGGWRFKLSSGVVDTTATNPGVTYWKFNDTAQPRRWLHIGGFIIPAPEGTVAHKIAAVFTVNSSAYAGQSQSMDLELLASVRTTMNFTDGLWTHYGEQISNTGTSGPFNNSATISGASQSTFNTDKIVDLFVSANNADAILGNYTGLIWGVR